MEKEREIVCPKCGSNRVILFVGYWCCLECRNGNYPSIKNPLFWRIMEMDCEEDEVEK